MTQEKFLSEINTLKNFFTTYCDAKHHEQEKTSSKLIYKKKEFILEYELCDECEILISYSIKKLQNCPHEIKPRCRQCPDPCYDKKEWKNLAKIMRFSGIRLGVLKIKKFFNF